MSRHGRDWLRESDDDDLAFARQNASWATFWRVVDSDQGPHYSHRGECPTIDVPYRDPAVLCGDWTHVRGDGCLAARSDRGRCNRPALHGVPFCDFHFGDAWTAMQAFVAEDRGIEAARMAEFTRESFYREHHIDVAMVRDAKRQLEKGVERVYFYLVGEVVKVGRSVDVTKRLKTLSGTKAPDGIDVRSGRLIGTIPGGCRVEGEMHLLFRQHRLVGEWFSYPPIADDIARVLAQFQTEETAA